MSRETIGDREARLILLQEEAARLQAEIDAEQFGRVAGDWARHGYYLTYYATAGFFLGMVAALVSLMFNIIGASVAGKDPLQIIRVYLTFGLGAKALDPAFENGLALAMGCVLYIATGMLLGIIFHVVLSRYASKAGLAGRLSGPFWPHPARPTDARTSAQTRPEGHVEVGRWGRKPGAKLVRSALNIARFYRP